MCRTKTPIAKPPKVQSAVFISGVIVLIICPARQPNDTVKPISLINLNILPLHVADDNLGQCEWECAGYSYHNYADEL